MAILPVPLGNLPWGYHLLNPLQKPQIVIDGNITRIHQPSRPLLHHLHPCISLHLDLIGKSHRGVTERTKRVSKTPPQKVVLDPKPAVASRPTKTLDLGDFIFNIHRILPPETFHWPVSDFISTCQTSSTKTDLLDVNFRVPSTRQRLLKQ